MSAVAGGAGLLQAATVVWLGATPALAGVRVFDAPPARAGLPYALVDEPLLVDWGAKDLVGREGTLAVLLHDAGERPVRLRALAGAVEAAMPALDPELGGGWRLANLRLSRSRLARAGADRWQATIEWRVRLYQS